MMKLNIKTFLLATSAICAVNPFSNAAKAQYSPTLTKLHDAGTVIPGVTPETVYPESVYTVTPVSSCAESTSATGGCFKTVSGYNESGNPIYQYYTYTVKTISDDDKADRVVNDPAQVAANNAAGKSYVGNHDVQVQADGGAIYSSTTMDSVIGHFIGNYASSTSEEPGISDATGGAIFSSQKINSITGDFISNYVQALLVRGGAISNIPKYATNFIRGDFIGNYAQGKDVEGGAIFNARGLQYLVGNFIGNYAYSDNNSDYSSAEGGAVYNSDATINNIVGNFISNYSLSKYSSAYGGAIHNYYIGKIESINGDFTFNHAQGLDAVGGAIYSEGTIDSITGNFVGNYVYDNYNPGYDYEFYADPDYTYVAGGAIAANGTLKYITGNFIGNYAVNDYAEAFGGAISNSASITSIVGNFISNYTSGIESSGGAISHNYSGIGSITGDFKENHAQGSQYAYGGAIYSRSGINSIIGDFSSNYVDGDEAYGGAIYNESTINSIAGDFIGNYAWSNEDARGGAIYNDGNIKSITGDFIDNYVSSYDDAYGGAVYNEGTMTFVADALNDAYEDDILFQGNYVEYSGNEAIYNKGSSATITFKSRNNGSYTFHDYVYGDDNATIKFVSESGTGTLNLYSGATITGQKQVVFDDANNDGSKWIISSINNDIEYSEIQNLNILTPTALNIDVDLDNETADMFSMTYLAGGSGTLLTLGYINLIGTFNEYVGPITYSYDTITTPGAIIAQDDFYAYGFDNSGYDLTYNGERTKKSFVPTLTTLNHDGKVDPATDEIYIKSAYRAVLTNADDYDFYVINAAGDKEYYKYVVNVNNDKKADRVNDNPTEVAANNDAGKSYIGIVYEDSSALGGAVYNESATDYVTGDFIADKADGETAAGGAIYNSGTIIATAGDFIANSAQGTSATGGAVYNEGTITSATGDFINNFAQGSSEAHGGAIYNSGDMGILADDIDILFQGNYVKVGDGDKQYEAIYNAGSSANLTFKSVNDGSYTLYDYINGDGNAIVNFVAEAGTGTLTLHDKAKIIGQNQVNFKDTDDDGSDWVINTANNKIGSTEIQNLNILTPTTLNIDVNFDNDTADTFTITYLDGGSGMLLTLGDINAIGTFNGSTTPIAYSTGTTPITTPNLVLLQGDFYSYIFTNSGYDLTYTGEYKERLYIPTLTKLNHYGEIDPETGEVYVTSAYNVYTANTAKYDFYMFNDAGKKEYYRYEVKERSDIIRDNTVELDFDSAPDYEQASGWSSYKYLDRYYYGRAGLKHTSGTSNVANSYVGNVLTGEFVVPSDYSGIYNSIYPNVYGGVIYNSATLSSIVGDFIENGIEVTSRSDKSSVSIYNYVYGGAVYNNGTIDSITGDFIANYIMAENALGGAIYNEYDGTIKDIRGHFVSNYTWSDEPYEGTAQGGAIYNKGLIKSITGDFIDNEAVAGGAIYNYGTIENVNSDFIANKSESGGAINNNSTIESIVGDFTRNYVQGGAGGAIFSYGNIDSISGSFTANYVHSSSASGGAIYNEDYSYIGDINADFTGNYVYSDDEYGAYAYGGAIHNIYDIESVTGNFTGNYAYADSDNEYSGAYGGAIYNSWESIYSITGDFTDNYAKAKEGEAHGGAIYTAPGTINFVADAGNAAYEDDVLFKGNYVQVGDGDKQYEAIYNDGYDEDYYATITFTSRNKGSYTFYDYINGNGYGEVDFTATDGTGTLNLYNDIKGQGNVNFAGNWNLDMRSAGNDETETPYNSVTASNIVVNNGLSTKIDVNFAENKADSFHATTSGSGVITLDTINLIGSPTAGTVQIVYAPTADLHLALGDAYDGEKALVSTSKTEVIDSVTLPLKWSDELYHKIITTNVYGYYALATTSTTYDSISLSNITEEENVSPTSIGDTLALLAHYDTAEAKNFNADPEEGDESITYVLGATQGDEFTGIGEMVGKLYINGSTTIPSTVDLNGKTGFILGYGATSLTLNDLTITDSTKETAATTVAHVTNGDASIKLHNAVIDGNITGTTTYAMAVDGNTELKGTVSNADIALNGGELKVAANSLSGSALTINSGDFNIRNNASTTVNELTLAGGKLDIDNKALVVNGKATFGAGTTLSLTINNVFNNFGTVSADEIDVDETAILNATLAQGLVDIGKTVTVQLLNATNSTDFNKFNEVENEMYLFTKNGLNGTYDIKQIKTAKDVIEEIGGSKNNAKAAKAWVDSESFEEGSVEAEIADKLSDLAQHNPEGFKSALTTLAPEKDDMMQQTEDKKAERLMTSINQRLNGTAGGQISMSSGDELGEGVSVWADVYHSKADVETTRKVDGFDIKANGAIFGMEKEFAEHKKVGIGYQREEAKIHGYNRKVDTTGNGAFVYGEYDIERFRLSTVLMYDVAKYKENKYTLSDVYSSDYHVNTFLAQQLVGYDVNIADGNFVPQTGLRYKHMRRDGYTDSAGQKVSSGDIEGVSAVLGINYSKEFEFNDHKITPEVYIGAIYDLKSDKDNAVVSLTNGSSYGMTGNRLHRFGTEFDTNIKADLNDNWTVKVQYSGEFREDYQGHSLSLGLRYNF